MFHKKTMHLLLLHFLSLLSLVTPISGCKRDGANPADLPSGPVYTISQHEPDRDSVNAVITGARRNAITVAVAKASPAVVGINVTAIQERQVWNPFADDPFFRRFFGGGGTQKYQIKELGSGFIISADGYILTNDHVAGNATKIIVTTTDGSQYDARLIGTDNTSDVSLLKISGKNLPYLKLGNSEDLAVGEWAIAMGNPFGLFSINDKPTVTVGVISNTGVNLGLEPDENHTHNYNYRNMIQTDAAISSGNSGGPLLNANGEVIGMNAVIRSTAQSYEGAGSIGLGFAIPINHIKEVIDRLRSGETLNHNFGDLGWKYQDVDDNTKEYFNLTTDDGVVIVQLTRGGLAEDAGFRAGDLITGLDDEKIRSASGLQSALADHEVGDKVTFHILRDRRNESISIKLPPGK